MDIIKSDITKSLSILVICTDNNKKEYEESAKNVQTLSVTAADQLNRKINILF